MEEGFFAKILIAPNRVSLLGNIDQIRYNHKPTSKINSLFCLLSQKKGIVKVGRIYMRQNIKLTKSLALAHSIYN